MSDDTRRALAMTELVLLAFCAGWLCKWVHGFTGRETTIDLVVLAVTIGGAVTLQEIRLRRRKPE